MTIKLWPWDCGHSQTRQEVSEQFPNNIFSSVALSAIVYHYGMKSCLQPSYSHHHSLMHQCIKTTAADLKNVKVSSDSKVKQ